MYNVRKRKREPEERSPNRKKRRKLNAAIKRVVKRASKRKKTKLLEFSLVGMKPEERKAFDGWVERLVVVVELEMKQRGKGGVKKKLYGRQLFTHMDILFLILQELWDEKLNLQDLGRLFYALEDYILRFPIEIGDTIEKKVKKLCDDGHAVTKGQGRDFLCCFFPSAFINSIIQGDNFSEEEFVKALQSVFDRDVSKRKKYERQKMRQVPFTRLFYYIINDWVNIEVLGGQLKKQQEYILKDPVDPKQTAFKKSKKDNLAGRLWRIKDFQTGWLKWVEKISSQKPVFNHHPNPTRYVSYESIEEETVSDDDDDDDDDDDRFHTYSYSSSSSEEEESESDDDDEW